MCDRASGGIQWQNMSENLSNNIHSTIWQDHVETTIAEKCDMLQCNTSVVDDIF